MMEMAGRFGMRRIALVGAVFALLVLCLAAWDLQRERARKMPMQEFVAQIEVRPGTEGMEALLAQLRAREEGSSLRRWAKALRDELRLWRDIQASNMQFIMQQ